MSKQYYALKASLPRLAFDGPPPMTSSRFLECCEAFLKPAEMDFLRGLSLKPRAVSSLKNASFMQKYAVWEICLRNTLAELRAGKLDLDPASYLVQFAEYETTAAAAAKSVFSMQGNPLDKELFLDRARWDFLESMEWKHSFDFDSLCIYRCKLQILEKWSVRHADQAASNLDEAAKRSENAIKQKQENEHIKQE